MEETCEILVCTEKHDGTEHGQQSAEGFTTQDQFEVSFDCSICIYGSTVTERNPE